MFNNLRELIVSMAEKRDASRQTGIDKSNIWKACTGKREHAKGFVWIYT